MIRLLIGVLFLAPFVLLSVSNLDPMTVWFVSFDWHVITGKFILAVTILSLLMGFFLGWIGELRQRHRARRAEGQIRSLEKEAVELHKRITQLQTEASSASSEAPSQPPRN